MSDALNLALDAIAIKPADDERTILAKTKVIAQMTGYDAKYADAGTVASSIEDEFCLPIVNPDTGKPSRNFTQAGRIDVNVRTMQGLRMVMDHKTSSMDIADPASAYWRQLAIDSQVNMYALACWQRNEKIDGSIWDVIRKPTIRPANISKELKTDPTREGTLGEIANVGTYYRRQITDTEREWALTTGRENESLYGKRLTADCLSRPTYYYQRRTVPRLDADILAWAEELWIIAKDIRETQLRADACERREMAWYRNSGACMNYGTPCEYLGLCSGVESPDSSLWVHREKPHEELNVESDESRWTVLSHSSIRCYQTCRRKAYYKYELRLERADDEEKDALFYGHLMHQALEAWWSHYLC